MSEKVICRTQAEVDASARRGDLIVIDSTWRESSRAVLRESSRAVLRESSSAVLRESSSAVLRGSSSAELRESSRAVLRGSSRAVLRGRFTGARLIGPDATATGKGTAYRVVTALDLADYCGLDVTHGHVTLYKAICADGTGGGGRGTTYEVGVEVVAPDWDPDPSIECGRGLHLSPSPEQARRYNGSAVAVLACRVALADIAVHEACLDKVRCRAVTPVSVVNEREGDVE